MRISLEEPDGHCNELAKFEFIISPLGQWFNHFIMMAARNNTLKRNAHLAEFDFS